MLFEERRPEWLDEPHRHVEQRKRQSVDEFDPLGERSHLEPLRGEQAAAAENRLAAALVCGQSLDRVGLHLRINGTLGRVFPRLARRRCRSGRAERQPLREPIAPVRRPSHREQAARLPVHLDPQRAMFEHQFVVGPPAGCEQRREDPARAACPARRTRGRDDPGRGGRREHIAQRFAGGGQPTGFGLGRRHANGHGVGPTAGRGGGGRQPDRKGIRFEVDHRARAGGATEQLGWRDEAAQHRAGGADPPQAVEPRTGGADVVGELDHGGVVVVHGVADPFRQGQDRLCGAGVERRSGDAVDATAPAALPADAAAARIWQGGAIEQRPDETREAQPCEHLRQDGR